MIIFDIVFQMSLGQFFAKVEKGDTAYEKGVEVCLTKARAPPVTPVALAAQSSRMAFGKRDSKYSE